MSYLESYRQSLNRAPVFEEKSRWYFRQSNKDKDTTDSLDRIKLIFKKYPGFYYFLIKTVSPVYSDYKTLLRFINENQGLVLNLGSGNEPKYPGVLNIDMMDYENVDIVCDIHQLPFKDGSVDAVINIAVLEHVLDPSLAIQEIYRVLKPGGKIFTVVPFMQPFHASPHDYQRYTLPGVRNLHRSFHEVETGIFSGPVSGILWVFQDFIAAVCSFGSPTIYNLFAILLMLIGWPLKFLDLFLKKIPKAQNISSNFYFIGKKAEQVLPLNIPK